MVDFHSKLHGKATSALEKGFANVVSPFQDFIQKQKTASILLLLSTLTALIIANSPLAASYQALIEMRFGFVLGGNDYSMSLHHWVNDGLMALFFFIQGLALLGGMGFTMSVFIATLGFADHPEQQIIAKTGILVASLLRLPVAAPGGPGAYRRLSITGTDYSQLMWPVAAHSLQQ
jgi:Na+/H+ antiporter NhaA